MITWLSNPQVQIMLTGLMVELILFFVKGRVDKKVHK